MPEEPKSIFNQAASEKLRSPDDLEKYVRVTTPSVWIVLAACIALLLGLLAWGVFGAVSTSVATTGVAVNGQPMCFLSADDVARVHVGDSATVDGKRVKVGIVAHVPLSREEARQMLGSDYLATSLLPDEWGYQVVFDTDEELLLPEGVPLTTNITVERVAPIRLILG